jgi:hypothetical protein
MDDQLNLLNTIIPAELRDTSSQRILSNICSRQSKTIAIKWVRIAAASMTLVISLELIAILNPPRNANAELLLLLPPQNYALYE